MLLCPCQRFVDFFITCNKCCRQLWDPSFFVTSNSDRIRSTEYKSLKLFIETNTVTNMLRNNI